MLSSCHIILELLHKDKTSLHVKQVYNNNMLYVNHCLLVA